MSSSFILNTVCCFLVAFSLQTSADEANDKNFSHVQTLAEPARLKTFNCNLVFYPPDARKQGLEGTVKIKVEVLADGSVGDADLLESSGHDVLDQSVLNRVLECHFEPAKKEGVPIASQVVIPIRFQLNTPQKHQ